MKICCLVRCSVWILALLGSMVGTQFAAAQLLLVDEFAGTGNVDTTVWRLPFGSEGTFVGRTQFRGNSATDMPQQGINEASAPSADKLVMEVDLDTYSPIDPGNQFLGTDILTKRNFARAGGMSYEATMRLKPTTTGGLVGAGFLFDVTRESPPGTLVRDEIDFELISNQAGGAEDPFTNVWNDGSFASGGNGGFVDVAGLDLTQFHKYRVDWTPASVKWYVDDVLKRTVSTNVPDDPMKLHFNLWAPDSDFTDAFNAALQPTATEGANQTYTLQVDRVEVNRINTTASGNLLTDASFENNPLVVKGSVPETTTGQWLKFGNVFIEADDIGMTEPGVPDAAVDGIFMLKQYGPFTGHTDASGVVQNVVAQPGEEFEVRAWAQTASGDTILGKNNFNTVQLSFLNSTGAVISDAPFVPTNGNDFPLLDGRDPNMQEDTWVEGVVSAIAPAGTAYAQVSLFFIQLFETGPLLGDYNGNGTIDAADYTAWRDVLTAGGMSLLNDPTPGTVDESDFVYWRDNFGDVADPAVADNGASWFDDVSLVRLTPTPGSGAGGAAGAVPEPNTLVLLVLGLVFSLVCRRSPTRHILT